MAYKRTYVKRTYVRCVNQFLIFSKASHSHHFFSKSKFRPTELWFWELRPDRTFYSFGASKSGDGRTLCCPETSFDWFWGSKIVRYLPSGSSELVTIVAWSLVAAFRSRFPNKREREKTCMIEGRRERKTENQHFFFTSSSIKALCPHCPRVPPPACLIFISIQCPCCVHTHTRTYIHEAYVMLLRVNH